MILAREDGYVKSRQRLANCGMAMAIDPLDGDKDLGIVHLMLRPMLEVHVVDADGVPETGGRG